MINYLTMGARNKEEYDGVAIGARVWELREAKRPHMSRERLAALAGIAANHVYRIEHGKHPHPTAPTVEGLAKALGVTVEVLTGGKDTAVDNSENNPNWEIARKYAERQQNVTEQEKEEIAQLVFAYLQSNPEGRQRFLQDGDMIQKIYPARSEEEVANG